MNYNTVQFERSFGTSAQLPESTLPEIAFAGRSNVGKSSLLNTLFNRKGLAKVSKTERMRWAELIEGYFNQDRNFALVCSLIDIRHPASELDENMVRFLQDAELPYLIVLTKGDKLSKSKCLQQRSAIKRQLEIADGVPMVITSSLKKSGMEDLRAEISAAL